MKILQVNKFYYKRGGAEAYMLNLSQMLKEQGHQVLEFSMEHPENLASDYSKYFIKNYEFSKQGWLKDIKKAFHLIYSFEAKKNLEKLIKQEKPDVAHLHNFYFHLTPSILSVFKKHGIPVIWTMHDYKLICPNYRLFTQGSICERCKVRKYYNCFKFKCIKDNRAFSFLAMVETYLHNIILKSYDKIDLYISPSKFLKDKVCQWGIDSGKVKQLYNFINLNEFKPDYELGDGLLYFGRLAPVKGLDVLLSAMKELPDIKLKIVGNGPQKTELEKYVKDNKLNNVEFIGHTTGQDLYNIIKSARFVVAPSVWYENNPISILESFALAKPVIGSNLGGIPELVIPGKTGVLFNPGSKESLVEAIKTNYSQSELVSQMGKNSRQFAEENFSQQAHLEQILAIYSQKD